MLNRSLPDRAVVMAQAAQAVSILLKEIRVHRADTQDNLRGVCTDGVPVVFFVPRDMDGDARANAGDTLHLGRVRQFLAQRAGRPRPAEDLEARPRISIAPRGRLDVELLQSGDDSI